MNGGRNKKDLKNKNKFNISKENFSNFINNIDKVDNLPVHFLPQVYFLKNAKGDIKVDNLGLVEDIEIEMSKLSKIVKFKIRDYQQGVRDSRSLFTAKSLRGGPVDPQEIVQNYINANRALYSTRQDFQKDIDGARVLG